MAEIKDLAVVKREVTVATKKANDLEIKEKGDLIFATDALSSIKTAIKKITERKDGWTRPAYDAYKQLMEQAKKVYDPLLNDLLNAERIVKNKMVGFKQEADRAAAEEEAKIAARVEKGQLKEETGARKMDEIERVDNSLAGDRGGAAVFKKKRVLVVADEDKIPDQYWFIDMVALRADGLKKGAELIPGTRIDEVDDIAASSF